MFFLIARPEEGCNVWSQVEHPPEMDLKRCQSQLCDSYVSKTRILLVFQKTLRSCFNVQRVYLRRVLC
jgi:hypothetical protein